jgi:hypothetical protein
MVKNRFSNSDKILVFMMVLVSVLVGCTAGETPNDGNISGEATQAHKEITFLTPTLTPTSRILPTRTLDLFRPDTIRATYAAKATQKASKPTPTPKSSSTVTLTPQERCQPFPDDIQYLGSTNTLGYPAWTLQANCRGEKTYFRSPVGDMTLLDYSALTGRFAYGSPNPNQKGLWVYDYWIEMSEKWSDSRVIKAEWSPVRNSDGFQPMAILDDNGTLSILLQPFQNNPIASKVCHFSIAPDGKRIAYVQGNTLYVVSIQGGQPRKWADGVNGTPIWDLSENAIILPSSPVKIAFLDGSDSFVPELKPWIKNRGGLICDSSGNYAVSGDYEVDRVLWDEQSHFLLFYDNQQRDGEISRAIHVYELSEDLHWVDNLQTIYGDFIGKIHWGVPGKSIIDSAGNVAEIGLPGEIFSVEARILNVEDSVLMVEFVRSPRGSSTLTQHLTRVSVADQTQIIDTKGHLTHEGTIKRGMIIDITARKLSPYTLSMFAYTIQITCDQDPCYLGIEG